MNFNSGSLLVFIVFIAILVALFTILIIILLQSKNKNKVAKSLKISAIVLSVLTVACCFVCPLTYYCDIPLNLRYGNYEACPGYYPGFRQYRLLVIHRDSLEITNSASERINGRYTLKNDILEVYLTDGTRETFVVKHFGSELVDKESNIKAFRYIGD